MDKRIYEPGSVIELYEEDTDSTLPKLFTLTECIGTGGSCVAYRAVNEKKLPVKLKQFRPADLTPGSDLYGISEKRFLQACRQQRNMLENSRISNITSGLVSLYWDSDGYPWSVVNNVEGRTLDEQLHQNALHDNIRVLLRLTESIRAYHEAGWLLLDIKPANILVVDSPGIFGVNFFDFDSFISMDEVQDAIARGENLLLSSSPDYSAPELQSIPIDLREVGPASDRYSVGAILFESLFGRTPDYADALSGSAYPFETIFGNLRARLSLELQNALEAFLRKTVTLSPRERFASDAEMITVMQRLGKLTEPERVTLSHLLPSPVARFKGRREEIERAKELLLQGKSSLFLCGFGGIGKTQLALKLAEECRDRFDFCYTVFRGSLRETVLNLPLENLPRTRTGPGGERVPVPEDELYGTVMSCLRDPGNRNTVLIVDNFDAVNDEETLRLTEDPVFRELTSLPLRVLFTTRCHFGRFQTISLAPLPEQDLLHLMKEYLPYAGDGVLKAIVRELGCHTLSVDIAARTMKESMGTLTPEELLKSLRSGRQDAFPNNALLRQLNSVFRVSSLGAVAQRVMAYACLFPLRGIRSTLLRRLLTEEEWAAAQRLERSGWLHYEEQASMWSMHPLVHTICEQSEYACPTESRVRPMVDTLRALEQLEPALSSDPDLYSQITEIYANYVRATLAVPSQGTPAPVPAPVRRPVWSLVLGLAAVLILALCLWRFVPGWISPPEPTPVPAVSAEPVPEETAAPEPAEITAEPTPDIPLLQADVSEAKLGREALEAIHSGIEYPKEYEYFDDYRYARVTAPGGHSVYGFGSADRQGSSFTVLNGEEVQILAERGGFSCTIVLSQNVARWINTNYLTPLRVPEN